MADPQILTMTESEFRRRYGNSIPLSSDPQGGAPMEPASSPSGLMTPAAGAQPEVITMPESEFRLRYGSLLDNAKAGITEIPKNLMSMPGALVDTATGSAGAVTSLATGEEATPQEVSGLRNFGSLAGGASGAMLGAEASMPFYAAGPIVGGAATLGLGGLGAGLGLLGIDWFAEKMGVDAPRTGKERLNSLAYNTTQGIATDGLLRGAGKVAGEVSTPFQRIATQQGREQAAADVLSKTYGKYASDKIFQGQVDGFGKPLASYRTTAELVGNEAAAQLQKQLETEGFGGPIGDQKLLREAARRAEIENLAPSEARIEDVQQAVTNDIQANRQLSRYVANQLPENINPMTVGDELRPLLEAAAGQARLGVKESFGAIPDKGSIRFAPTSDIPTAEARFKELYGPGSEPAPRDLVGMIDTLKGKGVEEAIPAVPAGEMPSQPAPAEAAPQPVDLDYLQRLRRWAGEASNEYYNKGKVRAGSVAGEVVRDVDNMLQSAVDDGSMTAEQSAAYRKALKDHQDMVNRFELGPTGRVLQRGAGTRGYQLEPSTVGQQFWSADTEGMQNFVKSIGGDAKARELLARDAMTDFRSRAMDDSGQFVPKRIADWMNKNQAFLDFFPDIHDSIQSILKTEGKSFNLEKNLGKFAEANPEQAAAVLMSGRKSAEKARQIRRAVGGNPDALGGLRRGTIDDMTSKLYGIDDLQLRPDAFKKYLTKNESYLREIFTPQQMQVFDLLYSDLSSEAQVNSMAARASRNQSITYQKTRLAEKLRDRIMDEFGIAGRLLGKAEAIGAGAGATVGSAGGLKGAGIAGAVGGYFGAKFASLAQRAQDAALATLARAAADPVFASKLLEKATPQNMEAAMKVVNPKLELVRSLLLSGVLLGKMDTAKAANSLGSLLRGAPTAQTGEPPSQMRDLASRLLQRSPGGVGETQGATRLEYQIGGEAPPAPVGDYNMDSPTVDNDLIDAMAMTESSNNPNAIGPQTRFGRAKGRLQLLDSTGREMFKKLKLSGKYDPFDAEQNTKIGRAYLGELLDTYNGSLPLSLAAYNWGPGNLNSALSKFARGADSGVEKDLNQLISQGKKRGLSNDEARQVGVTALVRTNGFDLVEDLLPAETRNYVRKVLKLYRKNNQQRLSEV